MRACGVSGSDAFYIAIGGIPPAGTHAARTRARREVVEVGADVSGVVVGDHVVINPMAAPSGIIGNGGAAGALADSCSSKTPSAEPVWKSSPATSRGRSPRSTSRWPSAATAPTDATQTLGPGRRVRRRPDRSRRATLAFKSLGVSHVVVVDLVPPHPVCQKALLIGADAVINSADEDVVQPPRRTARRGRGWDSLAPRQSRHRHLPRRRGSARRRQHRAGRRQKRSHPGNRRRPQEPVPVDFVNVMSNEITSSGASVTPTNLPVTRCVANSKRYALIVSHTCPSRARRSARAGQHARCRGQGRRHLPLRRGCLTTLTSEMLAAWTSSRSGKTAEPNFAGGRQPPPTTDRKSRYSAAAAAHPGAPRAGAGARLPDVEHRLFRVGA